MSRRPPVFELIDWLISDSGYFSHKSDDIPACFSLLERMDAFLDETDDEGRMPSYGKVPVAAIVGNEDGAHFCTGQLFQVLNDVGWTIPAVGACYWVGEAMGSTNFKDLKNIPRMVTKTANMVAGNAAHLAGLLQSSPYPG